MAWQNTAKSNDELVSNLKRSGLLTNIHAEMAMRSVDRAIFVPSQENKSVTYKFGPYADAPQSLGFGATVSAPWVQAMALNELATHISKSNSVTLDIGSGSGIMVAYIARVAKRTVQDDDDDDDVKKVVGIEVLPALVELSRMYLKRCDVEEKRIIVDIIQGNGWNVQGKLRYDAINVGAQAETLPDSLIELLKPGGRLVCPVGPKQKQGKLICVDKSLDGKTYTTRVCSESVRFVPLIRKPVDWNSRYASGWAYGKKPNEFLVECVTKYIEPSTPSSGPLSILCIAAGQGRNAVWLAQRGHHVVAIDSSEVGIRKACLLASQQNMEEVMDIMVADANTFKSKKKFDVIVDVFSSLSNKTRRVRNRKWIRMLQRDGYYLNVSFAPKHRNVNKMSGPVDDEDLVSVDMLRADMCKTMDVVVERTRQTMLREGSFHRGESVLTEFMARKKKQQSVEVGNFRNTVNSVFKYFKRFKKDELSEFVRQRTMLVKSTNSTTADPFLRCSEALLRVCVSESIRRTNLCRYCWIQKEHCMCSATTNVSTLKTKFQFTVIQHPNEFMRSTSSAKIALNHLESSRLLLYGASDHRRKIAELVQDENSVVLFPHENAIGCEEITEEKNVIVVDGSWKNCREMVNDITRMNPRIRFVCLNEKSVASFCSPLIENLKRGQGMGRISTLEAVALFLRETYDDESCSLLLQAEERLCAYAKSRHTITNNDVFDVKNKKEWINLIRNVATTHQDKIREGLRYCSLCKETLATPSRMRDHVCGKKHCLRVLKIASLKLDLNIPTDLKIAQEIYQTISVEVLEKTIPEPCDVALVRVLQGLDGKLKKKKEEMSTKGERLLRHDVDPPQNVLSLPLTLRKLEILKYDTTMYDLRDEAIAFLCRNKHLGSFPKNKTLEEFRPRLDVFRNFKARQQIREAVIKDLKLLPLYEKLVIDVVIPSLKRRLQDDTPRVFYYQYPCTLRLQPGPSKEYNRTHRDAEYGHQIGEINFWMPLSDYALTRTTLEVETLPGSNEFKPLDISIGEIAAFHGTLLHHRAPPNSSVCTRVSLDFRIGIEGYFDPKWTLKGIKAQHSRRSIKI